jgi:hypothetical protein
VLLAVPAFCQSTQVNAVTGVPDDVLYRVFFLRVLWYDGQAGGLGPPAMRLVIQQRTGLTSQQAASLTSIAKDWKSTDSGLRSSLYSLVAAGTSAASPQAQSLAGQAQRNLLDHLAQLQTAFGPASFYLLDLFVRRTTNITVPGAASPAQ